MCAPRPRTCRAARALLATLTAAAVLTAPAIGRTADPGPDPLGGAMDGAVAPAAPRSAPAAPAPALARPFVGGSSCARSPASEPGWADCSDKEPPLQDVISWAQGEAELFLAPAHAAIDRARGRGVLPVVRIRGRFADNQQRDWEAFGVEKGRQQDSEYAVDLSLEWDFADLAGTPVEAQARKELRDVLDARQAIAVEVTQLYFDRRRLYLDLVRLDDPDDGRVAERRLRLAEVDASLDALTGQRWTDSLRAGPEARPSGTVVFERREVDLQ